MVKMDSVKFLMALLHFVSQTLQIEGASSNVSTGILRALGLFSVCSCIWDMVVQRFSFVTKPPVDDDLWNSVVSHSGDISISSQP